MTQTTTASGLVIEDIEIGTGDTAEKGRMVSVHYTGWLTDGRKFDSSKDRNDPFAFPLGAGHVIRGWDEGVQGMLVGGKRKLTIPPELGYGSRGAGRRDSGPMPPWCSRSSCLRCFDPGDKHECRSQGCGRHLHVRALA